MPESKGVLVIPGALRAPDDARANETLVDAVPPAPDAKPLLSAPPPASYSSTSAAEAQAEVEAIDEPAAERPVRRVAARPDAAPSRSLSSGRLTQTLLTSLRFAWGHPVRGLPL
jgi:hypothetical protein